MSVDMSQFHGVFFEESQEHLDDMEHLLMNLDLSSPDSEDLNSIFRAAHSIKGGSGIFGFDALTGLTHVMENLLDKARKNQLTMTTNIVDTMLETVDRLKSILDSYREDAPIDWDSIEQSTQKLESLVSEKETKGEQPEEDDGFGLFETPPAEQDEAFGFFDEQPKPVEEDDTFGFFEPLEDEKPEQKAEEEQDFGFFEPLEENKAAAQNDGEGEDFGFFEPISENGPANQSAEKAPPTPATENKIAKAEPVTAKRGQFAAKPSASKESSSIRVDTGKIDSLVNLVGELVITQSMITLVGHEVQGAAEEKLNCAVEELSRNIREIQEAVMSMRMLPMSFAFNRFPRVVRDLANKLGKKVNLVIEGGNTEIDKGMIEKIVDPLTHLVRNSIDHGIEMPDVRNQHGKPEEGTVTLRAEQRGSAIVISIIDDGAGLDREKILNKAVENGLDVDDAFSDEQVWNLIFAPGFSTAAAVTDVSGRGVGMDVVKRNIESIGGSVRIESRPGQGSTFNINLPLTLAIVDGMCVSCAEQVFVIPLTNIVESIQPEASQIKNLANDSLLWVREEYWPILSLHQAMDITNAQTDPTQAVVVLIESSTRRFGLLVDALVGQQQVVIKSLEQHYRKVPGVAGATIMGDGSVALILDVESLASYVKQPEEKAEVHLVANQ